MQRSDRTNALSVAAAAALLLAGCGSSPVLEVRREVSVRLPGRLGAMDCPVVALSPTGRFFVGKMDTVPAGASRTVLRRIAPGGKQVAAIPFPDGSIAQAIAVDDEGSIYGVCQTEGTPISWKAVKLSPEGETVWERPLDRLKKEGFRLTFSLDDWRNVLLVSGPGKSELSLLWFRSAARPEMGIVSFSRADGKVTRIEDGVRTLTGPGYEVGPEGVFLPRKDGAPVPVLPFEDRPWALDFFRGRLLVQVSDDGGETGMVYILQGDEARELLPEPILFPIRNNGSAFYGLDGEEGEVRIYSVRNVE